MPWRAETEGFSSPAPSCTPRALRRSESVVMRASRHCEEYAPSRMDMRLGQRTKQSARQVDLGSLNGKVTYQRLSRRCRGAACCALTVIHKVRHTYAHIPASSLAICLAW